LKLLRKILLIILVASVASVGTVTGLVFAPGSPGLPYLSPTYQAEKASFQSQSSNNLGTVYEVWYIQPKSGELNTTLIVALSSNSPNTHFYGVSTAGVNSPYGNFSATVGTGKTWLVLPAASCPVTPDPTYSELVVLHADSPVGSIVFTFKCTQNPGTVVLGNPHTVIQQLAHTTTCTYNLFWDTVTYVNGNNATVWVHNMGGCNITPTSYYVMDMQGNVYSQYSWTTTTIPPGPGVRMTVLIGAACTSCSLTGNAFTFQYANRYVILFVMGNNVQFQHTTGTPAGYESLSFVGAYAFPSNTNVTFSVQNLGSATINFLSYSVNDSSGNYWFNNVWTTAVTPGSTVTLNIAIGSGPGGCGSACTYTGTPGAFNTFNTFSNTVRYTVKLVSVNNNTFSIQV